MRSAKTIRGLYELCQVLENYLPIKELEMAELGCYKGDSTQVWAQHFDRVHAIDPWCPGYDDQDKASEVVGEIIEHEFDSNTRAYTNIVKHKQFSFDAADSFANESMSFVYIDAEHTYSAVSRDLEAWLGKVSADGFIGGHDYKKKWPGVMEAVQNQFGTPDWIFSDSSWLVELNPSRRRNIRAFCRRLTRKFIHRL